MSITTDHLADVPHPARAIYFAEWDAGVSDPSRYYRGSTRVIDRVEDPHGDDIRVETTARSL